MEVSLSPMNKPSVRSEPKPRSQEPNDPVLSMLGVGKELWKRESGENFVDRLRSEDLLPTPFEGHAEAPVEDLSELVWRRIESHQGEEFKTATQLPFTYAV